jgi:hypothetical protein
MANIFVVVAVCYQIHRINFIYHTGAWRPLAPIHLANAASAVLARSANAAARLLLRSQAERKAATAAQSGEMQGEGASLHFLGANHD